MIYEIYWSFFGMDTTGHKLVYGGIVTGMCLQPLY